MANDALDPGPNGDFPFFLRNADGSPAWSRIYGGERFQVQVTPSGDRVRVDMLPGELRGPDGEPIVIPVLPPA